MTKEEKQLLLTDLSARLSYGVKVLVESHKGTFNGTLVTVTTKVPHVILGEAWIEETLEALWCDYSLFKPYLRPMSSMTEEEKNNYHKAFDTDLDKVAENIKNRIVDGTFGPDNLATPRYYHIDWLNAHHFDYRGLIEKGLALEAPKDMYK